MGTPALKLVDPKGVEPSICLLAKQMPLPHSSHGPVKMNDVINYTIRNKKDAPDSLKPLSHLPNCPGGGIRTPGPTITFESRHGASSDTYDMDVLKMNGTSGASNCAGFAFPRSPAFSSTRPTNGVSFLVWQPHGGLAIHAVGYAAPWVRCSPQLSPTRSWDFANGRFVYVLLACK